MYELPLVKLTASRLNEKRLRIQVVAGPRQVGKTTAVKQALKHYAKPFTYRLAEGLGVNPLAWLESEWQQARLQAKSLRGTPRRLPITLRFLARRGSSWE